MTPPTKPARHTGNHGDLLWNSMIVALMRRRGPAWAPERTWWIVQGMDNREPTPPLLHNRFAADAVGSSPTRPEETCFETAGARVVFHGERQDTSLAGWRRLLELIDEAAADGREVFRPLVELTGPERSDLVTLPATIAKLTRVKHLLLYGSPLVRIPPEIGAMTSLEVFEP